MSKIDFRTGDLLGRLGGMVGSIWKGIAYVRKMVIPFNPQSAAQTGVRDTFASLVEFGRRINSTILKLFTIPKPKKQSGFNRFIQINKAMIQAGVFTIADLMTAKGSLFQPPNAAVVAGTDDDSVTVNWDADLEGEALATDKIIIIVYNADLDLYAFETSKTRVDGTAAIAIKEETGDVIHMWLFATDADTLSSDSAYGTDTVS